MSEFKLPEHISYSSLKEFAKSPLHFWAYYMIDKEEKEYFKLGNLYHVLILQPEKFKEKFMVFDESKRPEQDKGMTSNKNKAWKLTLEQACAKDHKSLIKESEYKEAQIIAERVRNHEIAGPLVSATGNKFEQKIEWKYSDIEIVSLLDINNPEFIVDLKFMVDADPDNFHQKIFYLKYYLQAAMYLLADAKRPMFPFEKPFFFITVEKTEPYAISVNKMRQEYIDKGLEEFMKLIELYKNCDDFMEDYSFRAGFHKDGIFEVQLPYQLKD